MTLGKALARLGESVQELTDEDSRKSRRNRITAVAVRYAALLEVYGEMVKEIRAEVDRSATIEGKV